jgi:hypothetical protein
VAAELRKTDDDTVGPDASLLEDVLELRLLTSEDNGTGPVDLPVQDRRPFEAEIQDS